MKKKEKVLIDDLVQKVKDINNELNKIFDIVCDESEISVYKSSLLTAKLDALQLLLKEATDDLTSERARLFNLGFKIRTLELLLDTCTILMAFMNGFVGFGFLVINILISVKLYKIFSSSIEETKKCDDTINSTEEFDIVFENCYRLLKGHTNNEIISSKEELNNEDLRCIDLANEHIEIAMISGVVDNIPDDVRNQMVMMLQDDLQTSESNLTKLLEMANNKIIKENLSQEEMNLSRRKNSDFVEN